MAYWLLGFGILALCTNQLFKRSILQAGTFSEKKWKVYKAINGIGGVLGAVGLVMLLTRMLP